ncbi:MAG: RluA family pseudouridine synthase [Treponema sp.]|jgi:23S rRNA pseudouridine955/2504/2580 synthase|nr:RluA family pseudouridine synthase [Treponema sp.]
MALLQAGSDDDGRRLDRILRKALPGVPLSALHRLLRRGRILVDGRPAAAADRVAAGSVILVPDAAALPGGDPAVPAGTPVGTPAGTPAPGASGVGGAWSERGRPAAPVRRPEILAEGRDLLILNKPAGLAAHGPDSLDAWVQSYLENTLPPSLSFRPGPLHRLDRPSSGIIVFSKSLEGARRFSFLLKERRMGKYYLALAEGALDGAERWVDRLAGKDAAGGVLRPVRPAGRAGKDAVTGTQLPAGAGKEAVTWVRPLAGAGGFTLLLAKIATGRTHQIRAQAALRGHPLAGDRKYGGHGKEFFLHAWTLEIPLEELAALGLEGGGVPGTEGGGGDGAGAYFRITAPPPGPFRRRIAELFGENTLRNIGNPPRILSLFVPLVLY